MGREHDGSDPFSHQEIGLTGDMANSRQLVETSPNVSSNDVVGQAWIAGNRRASLHAESYLNALTTASRTPAIQYVAVTSAHVLFEHASGWADIRNRLHVDTATTMMAYSMSKTITALAALQLIETGQVGLDDPAEQYVRFAALRPECHHQAAHLAHIRYS